MSDDQPLIDRIAEALSMQTIWNRAVCQAPAAHIADDLRAAGYEVVKLPESDEGRDDWLDGTIRTGERVGCPDSVDMELDPGSVIGMSVEYARDLAAALLAAAQKVEEG